MSDVKWPTTLILFSVIGSVTVLGWQGAVDGQAVTSILGSIVGAVGVGHYVKTTLNGSATPPPGSTTTIVTPEQTTTVKQPEKETL